MSIRPVGGLGALVGARPAVVPPSPVPPAPTPMPADELTWVPIPPRAPKPAAPKPAPPKPAPAKPRIMRPRDLPRRLDVGYGGFRDELTNVDMIATGATRARYRRAEREGKILGDLVKSWDWFDARGRLKLGARQIADALTDPYTRTLQGVRPQGADVVVFDEVNDRLNVAPATFARGLALAKKRYPHRPLVVYLSHPERLHPTLLKAVEKHADRVLMEVYLWESREGGRVTPSDFDPMFAPIARTAPGILRKCHPILAISEKPGPYDFNDRKDVDFKRFLNDQAHALQHNRYTKGMHGLGAYATYEATSGTLGFYDKLVRWYSERGRNKKMGL